MAQHQADRLESMRRSNGVARLVSSVRAISWNTRATSSTRGAHMQYDRTSDSCQQPHCGSIRIFASVARIDRPNEVVAVGGSGLTGRRIWILVVAVFFGDLNFRRRIG